MSAGKLSTLASHSSGLRVLLTRSQKKNSSLISSLHAHRIFALSNPMLQLSGTLSNDKLLSSDLLQSDIIIAVSEPAVEYFREFLDHTDAMAVKPQVVAHATVTPLIAVGEATASALSNWLGVDVAFPSEATSEGLLREPIANNLLEASSIKEKQVVIVRGNGGREHIASELRARGANVSYLETYQRQPCVDVDGIWLDQWKSQQINCIVATSVEQFSAIWQLAHTSEQEKWLRQCTWIVASDRIKHVLIEHSINSANIHNALGANNNAVLKQLLALAPRFSS